MHCLIRVITMNQRPVHYEINGKEKRTDIESKNEQRCRY
jgi:hypothetical protein